ncbi:hypothetical protein [Brachyspira sp.]|nr:hypothetical protein [Brachyspira sp.]
MNTKKYELISALSILYLFISSSFVNALISLLPQKFDNMLI